jgi:hypothetical protein
MVVTLPVFNYIINDHLGVKNLLDIKKFQCISFCLIFKLKSKQKQFICVEYDRFFDGSETEKITEGKECKKYNTIIRRKNNDTVL